MSKVYKYQSDLDAILLECQCPGSTYFVFEQKDAFRFVFEDTNHPNNFRPPLKINPTRYSSKEAFEKCEGLGLSLYGKKEGAIQRFQELIVTFKNFRKTIGTHIALGVINDEDGHITDEDEITHFDMYEFENIELGKKFVIVEEL